MDQRYDPAFQRGHGDTQTRQVDPTGGRRSRLASLEEIAPQLVQAPTDGSPVRPPRDDRFDDGPRSRVQRRVEPFEPRSADDPAGDQALAPQQQARFDQAQQDEFLEELAAHRVRAAAWERALWAVGIIMTVGGAVAIWQATAVSFRGWTSNEPQTGYLLMQSLLYISPAVVAVGLATIVGLLFRRLLDHDRRSRS